MSSVKKLDRMARVQRGFSLIELLVVLVIMGLLAGIVAPNLFKNIDKAETEKARADIQNLTMALDSYRLDVGRYPENLRALIEKPGSSNRWNGPYLRKGLPKDPWDRDYQYRAPGDGGRPFDLFSLGADNTAGGSGSDQDVTSWQ